MTKQMTAGAARIFAVASQRNPYLRIRKAVADFLQRVYADTHTEGMDEVIGQLKEWAENRFADCLITGIGDFSTEWEEHECVFAVVWDLLLYATPYCIDPCFKGEPPIYHDIFGSISDSYASEMDEKYADLALQVLKDHDIHDLDEVKTAAAESQRKHG